MKSTFLLVSMLFCKIMAFQVDNSKLTYTSNKQSNTIKIGTIENSLVPNTINNLTIDDTIKFSFQIVDYGAVPEQIALLVGLPDRDLEIPIKPTLKVKDNSILALFKLSLKDIPKSILYFVHNEEKPISGTLIVASFEVGKNDYIFTKTFEMNLDYDTFAFDSFKEPIRYEQLPEIHHIFPSPPKTVSPFFAKIFVGIIILAGFSLLFAWISSGVIKFDNIATGLNLIYLLGFVVSIIGFELVFLRYYLGTNIFETINTSSLLGIFGLVIGTKYLRSIGNNI